MKEALKLALEALENAIAVRHGKDGTKFVDPLESNAITAIKEALAQPEQEPVAVVEYVGEDRPNEGMLFKDLPAGTKLYTTPQQRPWVGLTNEQREECTQSPFTEDNYEDIEDKLKELNT
jgi:hypothetical protein